jgi:hypothetical protein
MAFRIGAYVLRGELRNTRANGVYGWIEFAPDYGVHIELTGNLQGGLEGKHIKFTSPLGKTSAQIQPDALPPEVQELADRQIGVVGDVLLRRVQVPTIEIADFMALSDEEKAKHSQEKDCLCLEWFSQNGRIVAEIIDPEIDYVDDEEIEDSDSQDPRELDDRYGVGITEVYLDDEPGDADEFDPESDSDQSEDPYGLFGEDLQRSVDNALGGDLDAFGQDIDQDYASNLNGAGPARGWDETIPGIDPETKAMYEQWDEIFEGKKDEPVAYLFQTPLKLPPPEKVTTSEQAEPLVKAILAQLALLSVAIDVCEHYTPLRTYRLLMTEILPTAKVHPNLAASKMVQHYSTSDYCDACEAEFEAEFDSPEPDSPDD